MRTIITGGRILTPEVALDGKILVIEDRKILDIVSGELSTREDDTVIELNGFWISPGMIDVHVHGAIGFDTMDSTHRALAAMGRYFARQGVTSYLPTTMSVSADRITNAIDNVASCPQPADGAQHLGIHLEGPYFAEVHRGAQSVGQLRDADPKEYNDWLRPEVVKLVSVAPERKGVMEFIKHGVAEGIEFSVAHSGATFDQVTEAADHGLRQATHTFNGMLGLHHREPGTVGAVLTDDRIFAQVIADGVHVHPAIIKLIARLKGIDRTILITDAIQAVGLEDGEYKLGIDKIFVKDGISRTEAGGLAGSTLTMHQALRNMISFTGWSFEKVLPMATSVPATAMGWYGKKGVIRPGADADIIFLDRDLHIRMTMVSGQIVYQNL